MADGVYRCSYNVFILNTLKKCGNLLLVYIKNNTFALRKKIIMATTRLKGKTQRRRARTEREHLSRKVQAFMPVIKKVDVEDLKASFKKTAKKETKKAEPKKEEVAPKAETTEKEKPAKKAAAKKTEEPKAEKTAKAKKEDK